MKYTWILVCLLSANLLGAAHANASSDELQRSIFVTMLLDDNPVNSRVGAQSIARAYPSSNELCDLIAARLLQDVKLQENGAYVDTLAWYARILGELNTARYRDALNLAKQRYTNKKVLARVKDSLSSVGTKPAEQYVFQELDLAGMRADARRSMAAQVKPDRKAFGVVRPDASLNDVLDALGAPDDVTSTTIVIGRYGRGTILLVHYAGAGLISFRYDSTPPLHWAVIEASEELIPVKQFYTGTQFGLAQSLASFRGETFRLYLHYNARAALKDPSARTVLIQRVLAVPYPADELEDIGHANAIKMLARHLDPAMRQPVEKIAVATNGPVTRKMAKKYVLAYTRRESEGLQGNAAASPDEDDAEDLDENKSNAEPSP